LEFSGASGGVGSCFGFWSFGEVLGVFCFLDPEVLGGFGAPVVFLVSYCFGEAEVLGLFWLWGFWGFCPVVLERARCVDTPC
jgi:hypothetical protein